MYFAFKITFYSVYCIVLKIIVVVFVVFSADYSLQSTNARFKFIVYNLFMIL